MVDKEWIISLLVLGSVVLVFVQSFYNFTGSFLFFLYIFDLVLISILGIDFYKRVTQSQDPKKYLITHIYEIPAMIPLLAFGLLEMNSILQIWSRSLRLFRLFRIVNLLSKTNMLIGKTNARLFYIGVFAITSLIFGAISIFTIESDFPNSKITNLGDAFWWAIGTVTMGGYGDVYPITIEGKIIASILMFIGIAIFGLLISTIGVGLIESKIKEIEDKNEKIKSTIKERIDNIEKFQRDEIISIVTEILALHARSKKMVSTDMENFCSNCEYNNFKPIVISNRKVCDLCKKLFG